MPEGTEQTEKQEETTMNTTYFDEMTANCDAWENAKKERDERKQKIYEIYGWNSAEMDDWKDEDRAAVYPYRDGEMRAFRFFKFNLDNDNDEFEVYDSIWNSERRDFVETLRKLGVTEFTVTSQSTGLMDDIYGYIELGCTMAGLHTITKKFPEWRGEGYETVKGILFKVN